MHGLVCCHASLLNINSELPTVALKNTLDLTLRGQRLSPNMRRGAHEAEVLIVAVRGRRL